MSANGAAEEETTEDYQTAQSAESRTSKDGAVHVELTHAPLDVLASVERVKRAEAGAVVMFAGTTRNHFEDKPVAHLEYSAYVPLALRTLLSIAGAVHAAHGLTAISITHRLGTVPIREESILVVVSAPHRHAAFRGGEEALEEVKARAEIWKLERFAAEDGSGGGGEGVWRANKDGV